MRSRILCRTGLNVVELSLGTVELGLDYGISTDGDHIRPTEEAAGILLDRALELGINLIDTARAYGNSEEIIGRRLGPRRREFVLATKVSTFGNMDLSSSDRAQRMQASIEESLVRLCTDAVDTLLLHTATEREAQRSECLEVLQQSKRRGLARFTGTSVYGVDAALDAVRSGLHDCIQIAWSALDRRAEAAVLAEASRAQVGLMIRSVLMRGALTRRWRQLPEQLAGVREAASRLEELASSAGITLPELAYRYVLSEPGPLSALAGTARISELEECVRYANAGSLPAGLLQEIRKVEVEPALLDLSRWPPV